MQIRVENALRRRDWLQYIRKLTEDVKCRDMEMKGWNGQEISEYRTAANRSPYWRSTQ